jgi:hypothetical protein
MKTAFQSLLLSLVALIQVSCSTTSNTGAHRTSTDSWQHSTGKVSEEPAIQTLTADAADAASSENHPAPVLTSFTQEYASPTPDSPQCDQIILKSGDETFGKVVEITNTEVLYKKCTNPDGPSYHLSKADVLMVKYPNGTKDVLSVESPVAKVNNTPPQTAQRKVSVPALLSFIFALCGLLIAGIPLGIAALVLGIVGVVSISSNREKRKGLGFALTGIILGLLDVILVAVLVASTT